MARSLSSRVGEWQYSSTWPCSSSTRCSLDRDVAGRLHLGGQGRIELALAQLGDHHVVEALLAQPEQIGLGGDARIYHHRRARGRVRAREHAFECGGLVALPAKNFARRTNPLASSAVASMPSGQSLPHSLLSASLALAQLSGCASG